MNKRILCLDFDGVCNSYKSGWQGETAIPDDAVPGLFEFIEQASKYFDVQIYSTRSNTEAGRNAMLLWFYDQRKKWRENGGNGKEKITISFPDKKPAAFITLDDRAITFAGTFPDVDVLLNFKPWYRE